MRKKSPDILVRMGLDSIPSRPAWNIIWATAPANLGFHRERVIKFIPPVVATGLYRSSNHWLAAITAPQWLTAMNSLYDFILAGRIHAVTPPGVVHEALQPSGALLRGGSVLFNPDFFLNSQQYYTALRGRVETQLGLTVDTPDSVIIYAIHILLTFINGRILDYYPVVAETWVSLNETHDVIDHNTRWTTAHANYAATGTAPYIDRYVDIRNNPQFLSMLYNSPFRSEDLVTYDEVTSYLATAIVTDQKEGYSLLTLQQVLTGLTQRLNLINEHLYTAQAYQFLPENKIWFLQGNVLPISTGRLTIGHDTFKYSPVEAESWFGSFANSCLVGFLEDYSFEGLGRESKTALRLNINKEPIVITAQSDRTSQHPTVVLNRYVGQENYIQSPLSWYFKEFTDGRNYYLSAGLTVNMLYEGILKFNYSKVTPEIMTKPGRFTTTVPRLDIPFLNGEFSLNLDATGAIRNLVTAINAGPHGGPETNHNVYVSKPIVNPDVTDMYVTIPEIKSNWVNEVNFADYLAAGHTPLHYIREQYGIDAQTLMDILNYWVSTWIITRLIQPGDLNVKHNAALVGPVITADQWRAKVAHQNLLDYMAYKLNF